MASKEHRGSDKLKAAWKARVLSEESMREISEALDKSPAKVESVNVIGGATPTGIQLTLSYDGDDGPWCGNDIAFWLRWHRLNGGVVHPPKIIVNGTPYPDLVKVQLGFGDVGQVTGPIPDPWNQMSGVSLME
jgi:hypothetical protein